MRTRARYQVVRHQTEINSALSTCFERLVEVALPRLCLLCGRPVNSQISLTKNGNISPKSFLNFAGVGEKGIIPRLSAVPPLCAECARKLAMISGERCAICGKALLSEHGVCYLCKNVTKACKEVFPLFRYTDSVKDLVRIYKRSEKPSLSAFWADSMCEIILAKWPDGIVVPVPPRPEKALTGAWDPVEAIARKIERRRIEVRRLLKRKTSIQQKRLNKEKRKVNSAQAYYLDASSALRIPAKAILLDDVYTTGATVDACAALLLGNGCGTVSAIVIAAD